MILRPATAADAALLSRLHAESWRASYPGMVPQPYLDALSDTHWVKTFTEWLTGEGVSAQIATVGGVDVGCVLYGRNPGAMLPDYLSGWGEIISLYVLAAHWRLGVGKALLHTAMHALQEEKRPGCYLWALRENTNARRFYESQGFSCTKDTIVVPLGGAALTDFRYIFMF